MEEKLSSDNPGSLRIIPREVLREVLRKVLREVPGEPLGRSERYG
jgi:hypothetical protein